MSRRRRSSGADQRWRGHDRPVDASYGELAADYHWLYDTVELRLGTTTPGVRAAFHGLAPGARVLDAACGIGLDAISLHRRGFVVTATDASGGMVGEARRRVAAAGCEIPVDVCAWAELPDRFAPASFDAVLCTGNSIAHLRSEDEMVRTFRAFARVLAPGGLVILDTHHWERWDRAGERTLVDPVVVERGGARCRRSYRWSRPAGRVGPWRLELVLEINGRGGHRTHELLLEMVPFTTGELRRRLRAGGFTRASTDAAADDRYTAIGRRG